MKKQEFLKMMWQDNETQTEPIKSIHNDVFECMHMALSQSPDTFEVTADKTLQAAYELILARAKEKAEKCANKSDINKISVGPFEAAEILAQYLGTTYERPSKLFAPKSAKVNLDDFI